VRVAEAYRDALAAGVIPAAMVLPGGLGRQRIVRISRERIHHITERRPDWAVQCLTHLAVVVANPEYLGYRPASDLRRVEFVRHVGAEKRLILVAVKFLDSENEAWVTTALPMDLRYLTRRLRSGTMQLVGRGP
jgi:hypothetical protein